MPNYEITYTETRTVTGTIKADSKAEAEDIFMAIAKGEGVMVIRPEKWKVTATTISTEEKSHD